MAITPYNALLTSRAVVLFALETTYGVAATLSPLTNALLVENPDYTVSPQKIERNFAHADLSPLPFRMGRITAELKFSIELMGNNAEQNGLVASQPAFATLLQACGFATAGLITAVDRTSVYPDLANVGVATWAVAGSPTNVEPAMFTFLCTTGGNASAAKFTLSCNNSNLLAAPVTNQAISAAVSLGTTGVTVTPTVTTNFAIGDVVRISVMPEGVAATPISTAIPSATFGVYYDGLYHLMTAAYGTVQISATAGEIAKAEFTFMGVHNAVTDAALPTNTVFPSVLPPLFESALLTWGDNINLGVKSMTFNLGAQMQIRESANNANGYVGFQYTKRQPVGGVMTEATTTANNDFWGDLASSKQKYFMMRVGNVPGNQIILEGARVQNGALKYSDDNNTRMYDLSLEFVRYSGNDEVRFVFA